MTFCHMNFRFCIKFTDSFVFCLNNWYFSFTLFLWNGIVFINFLDFFYFWRRFISTLLHRSSGRNGILFKKHLFFRFLLITWGSFLLFCLWDLCIFFWRFSSVFRWWFINSFLFKLFNIFFHCNTRFINIDLKFQFIIIWKNVFEFMSKNCFFSILKN